MYMSITLSEIKKYAIKSGYENAEYLTEWNGYSVYEPFFNDEETHYIGLPRVILVKDGKIRLSNDEESFAFLDEKVI